MERGDARDRFGPSVPGLSHASIVATEACSAFHRLGEYFRLQSLHGDALVIGQALPTSLRRLFAASRLR
jgi:hypothetical protein